MECKHEAMPKQERPRTVIEFTRDEVAYALRAYAAKHCADVPTGEMIVFSLDDLSGVRLCIEREEGQEVWPPEEAK